MSNNKLCKNCVYFRLGCYFKNNYGTDSDLHYLELTDEVDDKKHGICLNEKVGCDYVDHWTKRLERKPDSDWIYASCDEERAFLSVGKDFGCIHWSPII